MVSVTGATLSQNLPLHIRDVLRQNVSDPQGRFSVGDSAYWIFKNNPKELIGKTDFPYVIINLERAPWLARTMGNKGHYGDILISITVFHDDQKERDDIADDIRRILTNQDSEDADGVSFRDNLMRCVDVDTSNSDLSTSYPETIRIADLTATFRYRGG